MFFSFRNALNASSALRLISQATIDAADSIERVGKAGSSSEALRNSVIACSALTLFVVREPEAIMTPVNLLGSYFNASSSGPSASFSRPTRSSNAPGSPLAKADGEEDCRFSSVAFE